MHTHPKTTMLVIALTAAGCAAAPRPPELSRSLSPDVPRGGERIYVGRVYPLHEDASEPTYVYERRVTDDDGAILSTHVTRDAATGGIALAESARHTEDYALLEYHLHTSQLGQTGDIRVGADGVSFVVDGDERHASVERTTDPVVVGPTLVGFIVSHLDELRAGNAVPVRMAVLDRLETIGFELEAVDAVEGQTRVRMSPSSPFVALVVDPIDFTFDTASSNLLRLEGRVPPKVWNEGSWDDFDARVEYEMVAARYR